MKELTGIRLINWHYFRDATLRFQGTTLITGDNSAGKSTIIDAIQLVLVGDRRQIRFNSSAHEETNRSLAAYVRCRTGVEGPGGGYVRHGDVTSYVVLEFFDAQKGQPFLLGVVIDAAGEGFSNLDRRFFKAENTALDDRLLLDNTTPRNISALRSYARGEPGLTIYSSVESYRMDLLQKLGSLSERFFPLLVKAIGFRAITDIRQFVYEYVLDSRDIDMETMLKNFRHYRDLEVLAEQTERRIGDLDYIIDRHDEIQRTEEAVIVQEYLIRRARVDHLAAQKTDLLGQEEKLMSHIERLASQEAGLGSSIRALAEEESRWRAALSADSAFQQVKHLEEACARLDRSCRQLLPARRNLLENLDDRRRDLSLVGMDENGPDVLLPAVQGYLESMDLSPLGEQAPDQSPVSAPQWHEDSCHNLKEAERIADHYRQELFTLDRTKNDLGSEIEGLKERLASLSQSRHIYPEEVVRLQQEISNVLGCKPPLLCELLDIPEPRWQNAVEGLLGDSRFDILVPGTAFDRCLSAYRAGIKEWGLHSAGVAAAATGGLPEIPPGSLAREVTAVDPGAMEHLVLLLGDSIKCDDPDDLKNHHRAVTDSGLTYMDNTLRQLDPALWEFPFIGQRAFARQREQAEKKLEEANSQRKEIEERVRESSALVRAAEALRDFFRDLPRCMDDMQRLSEDLNDLNRTTLKLEAVDRSSIRGLEKKLALTCAERDEKSEALDGVREEKIGAQFRGEEIRRKLSEVDERSKQAAEELDELTQAHPQAQGKGEQRYPQEIQRLGGPERVIDNFTGSQKGLTTTISNLKGDHLRLQLEYNSQYHFGAAADGSRCDEYIEEHRKLVDSELPQYRERIEQARQEADQQFKEHFVNRLREYIQDAQREFSRLNLALRDVTFGSDSYHFVVGRCKAMARFYDMIMDTYLLGDGHTLFSENFKDRHQDAMDELFDKVLFADPERLGELASDLTDYRNYLDYDIRITHAGGESSLFSNVSREKSGGETQTPYYVAIVASFAHLYRLQTSRQSARLMLFDEAFNRMDGERVETSLKFIKSMGLQAIIAVPTDRSEEIIPHVNTTLLVFREGHEAWIETFQDLKKGSTGGGE